jgi:GTP-binding protein
VKIAKAEFRAAATAVAEIPPAESPEVALAGRSNVGKSTLINALTGRKKLARTSQTPGCTRGLIFYNIDDRSTLVDLPGYGWAKRSKAERSQWKRLVEHYLARREGLAGVLILIDVRRGPEQEELDLADFLDQHGLRTAWALTKCDKLKRGALAARVRTLRAELAPAPVISTSSNERKGLKEIWAWMSEVCSTPGK